MKKSLIGLLSALLLMVAGCARDGNFKEAAYETVRVINNMHEPAAPGENRQNEWNYREYEQKRSEVQDDHDRVRDDQPQHPEWLIGPNR
jgi:hypothetical protein